MDITTDRRILVVDDMASIHDDFRRILAPERRYASLKEAEDALLGAVARKPISFQVDSAYSGEEGIRLMRAAVLEKRPYAMAFVDMRMPAGWDGVRTIEEMWREDDQLQTVICTAYSDLPLEEALTRLGEGDKLLVLKKPFDPFEVAQMARALCAKRWLAAQSASYMIKLQKVLQEVQQAAAELRHRNQDLEMVVSSVARDLRSPMVAIGMLSSLISEELRNHRSDKVDDYLERLRAGAKYGEQLVDGALSLTEIACADFAPELLDLSEMARESIIRLSSANSRREVSVSVQDGLRAWGDKHLVGMALAQLLNNAWKFTSRQASAAITFGSCTGSDGESIFFVRDSGCGFDAAHAGNLFHKFQKLHPPGQYGGGGTGLVIVGRILERHRGRLWADSRPGQGTTVFFTLPNPNVPNSSCRGW